jgi:PAS domain S-box-containing protein
LRRRRGSKQVGRIGSSLWTSRFDEKWIARFVSGEIEQYFYVSALPGGKLEYMSPSFERVWMRSPKVLESKASWFACLHPEDVSRVEETLSQPEFRLGARQTMEYRIVRPDGAVRWIRTRSEIYRDEEEGRVFRIGIGTDVTEQKVAEMALLESNRMLEERNRELDQARRDANASSQAKSEFLSVISHEIRTPVHAISGTCQLLLRSDLDSEQRRRGEVILDCCQGLLGVVNDFLDLGKIEAGRLALLEEPFSIANALSQSVSLFSADAAKKNLELKFLLDEDVPSILLGDETRFRQILINLIGNAVKFTDHGFVSVHVDVDEMNGNSGNSVLLTCSVADTGVGISAEKHRAIFEPFIQAESTPQKCRSGTGLGLSIVERLVKLMGGRIDLASELGRGSCFQVVLPLRRGVEIEKYPVSALTIQKYINHNASASCGASDGLKVLVADDNPIGLNLAREMLSEIGYSATTAKNGREVLEEMDRLFHDVFFLDIEMPEMDGLETAREIRKRFTGKQRPTIIALTAFARSEDRRRCLDSGMDDYITKPLDLRTLASTLSSLKTSIVGSESEVPDEV